MQTVIQEEVGTVFEKDGTNLQHIVGGGGLKNELCKTCTSNKNERYVKSG
jgi:hypothetical protein